MFFIFLVMMIEQLLTGREPHVSEFTPICLVCLKQPHCKKVSSSVTSLSQDIINMTFQKNSKLLFFNDCQSLSVERFMISATTVQDSVRKLHRCVDEFKMKAEYEDGCET